MPFVCEVFTEGNISQKNVALQIAAVIKTSRACSKHFTVWLSSNR